MADNVEVGDNQPIAPKISVLISLYQPEEYIEEFLERVSYQKALPDTELIFLINEDTLGYVTKMVRDYNPPQLNCKQVIEIPKVEPLYTSWNRGIGLARGKYLCNFNVDDYHMPKVLDVQARILDQYPEYGLSFAQCAYTQKPLQRQEYIAEANHQEERYVGFVRTHNHRITGCCPMWRAELHEKYGLFDDKTYKAAADHDMWIRFLEGGEQFGTINVLGVYQYLHPGTLTERTNSGHPENEILFKKYGRKYE